ncbi:hypothetical protein VTK73DRAFT_2509 [Phialemonium thermophilum]|uniref:Uncharacterized protein n=1 Tax=Phialemonium thermophilum TaxID=223376 RepID=A0ABR3X4M8_9PEZI
MNRAGRTVFFTLLYLTASFGRAQITELFQGRGRIAVLNSSSLTAVSPATNRIGCLDADGALVSSTKDTIDGCATYTRLDEFPYTLSTARGNCSFGDANMQVNTDSAYGARSHAWHCWEGRVGDAGDRLYTIDGFSYPLLCNLDLDCFYDVKAVPGPGEKAPVWQFFWGSQQMGITPGHLQVVWLWEPLDGAHNAEDGSESKL